MQAEYIDEANKVPVSSIDLNSIPKELTRTSFEKFNRTTLVEKLESVFVYPVSYTHLRAHETVLDLVCRLLLEKKHKKKKKKHTDQLNNDNKKQIEQNQKRKTEEHDTYMTPHHTETTRHTLTHDTSITT